MSVISQNSAFSIMFVETVMVLFIQLTFLLAPITSIN